ncbi:MAG: peroxiredoxin family protein [Bacteroidota bacterium]|nr:peroxiredoxin family protein [Bacteroidota bacterium]
MRSLHLFTSIGLIFVATGVALLPSSLPFLATVYAVLAYLFSMKEVSTYTSFYQFIMVFAAAFLLGWTVDLNLFTLPLLLASTMVAAAGSICRIVFFRTFGYTQHSWFEPTMLFLAFGLYLSGNVMNPTNWAGWLFPGIVLLFQGILAYGILKDKKQLNSFTKGGYKIAIGKEAPDFTLPDQDGQSVSISDFTDKRNLLLIFVRGDWCPGCHMMLRTYERERERFQEKNILVMAIGPDPVGVNRDMVLKLGLDFKVLSDEKQRTAMRYGVQLTEYDNDFAEKYDEGIPLPASFLVDKKGIVQYVSRPDKIGEFLDPRTIFPILDKLNY